ncbi:unnamed protein product, partial [Brachionus calyciflorus]
YGYNPVYIDFDAFEESSIFKVISQLIDVKKDNFIIDLTQIEMNQIVSLDLTNLPNLKSLNENVLYGLENLEILHLSKMNFLKFPSSSYKNLLNLNKLILNKITFKNLSIFKDSKYIDKLSLKNCCFVKNQLTNDNYEILNNLKSLESDIDLEIFEKNYSTLEILSLEYQTLKNLNNFKMLKFLNIRNCSPLECINFLNDLNQMEFLDFKLPNNLIDSFELVNLYKLKFLVLTCENIPNFNESFKNLQGLELINAKSIPRDQFVNLINVDYLAL